MCMRSGMHQKKTKLRLSMDNLLKRTQVNTNQYFETQGMLWRSSYTKPFRYFRLPDGT